MADCFGLLSDYEDETFTDLTCNGERLERLTFHECTFKACNFNDAEFIACRFVECAFVDCEMNLITVTDSRFSATFTGCGLKGINWTSALTGKQNLMNTLRFTGCTLNYSTFIGVDLRKATIKDCTAHDVDFSDAMLTDADLTGTDFAESRFSNTDLTGANLTGARHYHIDARHNTVKGAKFQLPEAISLLRSLDIVLVGE